VESRPAAPNPPQRGQNGLVGLARFGADPLGFLDGLRADPGEVVRFKLGTLRCHLVVAPELVRQVLESKEWPPLSRGRLGSLARWYSGGLILTEGTWHHFQRKTLWLPVVDEPSILEITARRALRCAVSWRDGATVDVFDELRTLVRTIDWQLLTGNDLGQRPDLLQAHERGIDALAWLLGPFGNSRWSWPLPSSARARSARSLIDAEITRMIEERRTATGHTDLLAWLVGRLDTDVAEGDELIRATVKQWLGADQLHSALTWALYLLAAHPEVEVVWRDELERVLSGRTARPGDVELLPYTRRVLLEAMRLYPPIWGFFRQLTGEWQLGGSTLAAGDVIALSPWFTHRDGRLWRDALRFDPDRWGTGRERPPTVSYFPYSTGPYGCPAHELSPRQGVLVLATLGKHWRFRLAEPREPTPLAAGVIAPKGGLRMTVTATGDA
jgi:cytochrome P450